MANVGLIIMFGGAGLYLAARGIERLEKEYKTYKSRILNEYEQTFGYRPLSISFPEIRKQVRQQLELQNAINNK